MNVLFIALSVMVLALLGLLLWFVPHLLQQQATRVAGETTQLREMLLDLLNEQEAVTLRQTQLGSTLARLQKQIEGVAIEPRSALAHGSVGTLEVRQLESRLAEVQQQIQQWADARSHDLSRRNARDNESWGYLLSLLTTIQERVGQLSHTQADGRVSDQAAALLEEIEREMHNLRGLSHDIANLQQRVRRSLDEHEPGIGLLRATTNGSMS
jgi:septation ring formation regulator EzrA